MNLRLLAVAAAGAGMLVPAAEGAVTPLASSLPQTTAPPPIVSIKIKITDSRISISPRRAQRGVMARFILLNLGKKPHTFSMGHQKRGRASQTGFSAALRPSQQHILIYYLDYRGKLPYFGSLPADRSKPGMKGTFTIF